MKSVVITAILAALLVLGVLLIPSCRRTIALAPNVTGDNITKSLTRNEVVQSELKKASPVAGKRATPHIQTSSEQMKLQAAELKDAKASNLKDREHVERLNAAYVALENQWYVKLGRWLTGLWRWLIAFLVLGVVLRIVSMFVGGAPGTVMSAASTGIFGVLTGGISWVQSLFDNAWFRSAKKAVSKRARKPRKPTEEPSTPVAVEPGA